jgi:periodic tryptophan protein 2
MLFVPTDLDIAITPQAVDAAICRQDYSLAVNMALHLGEHSVLKKAVDSVTINSINLVVKSIDVRMLRQLLRCLAEELVTSRHIEYYLHWCWHIISSHGQLLQSDSMPYRESIRALIRAISNHEKEIMIACDQNQFSLMFISSQLENCLDGNVNEDYNYIEEVDEVNTSDNIGYFKENKSDNSKVKKKAKKNT